MVLTTKTSLCFYRRSSEWRRGRGWCKCQEPAKQLDEAPTLRVAKMRSRRCQGTINTHLYITE